MLFVVHAVKTKVYSIPTDEYILILNVRDYENGYPVSVFKTLILFLFFDQERNFRSNFFDILLLLVKFILKSSSLDIRAH